MFYLCRKKVFCMPNPTVLMDKLRILTDAAKYDVACTSSGLDRKGQAGGLGSAVACGICHSLGAAYRFSRC